MKVSVIVTTKNEEKNIKNCLDSIRKQTYPKRNIEILVVDNNSSDRTKELAKKYTKHVFNKGPERSAQRNFGVSKSSGDYILYLDADMILHPDVIKKAVALVIRNPKIVALYISEIVIGNSFFAKIRQFERSFYDGTVIDCVRFIKRDIFQKVGGFDKSMSGPEDWDLDKKIRARRQTAILKTPIYHNESTMTLTTYLKKKKYYSQSFYTYISKWGKDDADVKRQFGFYYRFLIVFIEKNKWIKLVQHPLLFLGMMFLRGLVGITFLQVKMGDHT